MNGKGVIIGCGRIGAPMLAWMHAGKPDDFEMVGLDTNSELISQLREGDTGWYEDGMDDYYRDNSIRLIDVTKNPLVPSFWDNVSFAVVCLGSPVIDGVPNVNPIRRVIDSIPDHILIVLRSTVPPGFTEQLTNETGKVIIFAPERILTGNALSELDILPQSIGIVNPIPLMFTEKYNKFTGFFNQVSVYDSKAVELSKIGNNVIRYIEFTAGTQMANACQHYGVDWQEVRKAMTDGYSRGNMCFPSFTSSYCLNKDFQMLDYEVQPPLSLISAEYNQRTFLIDLLVQALMKRNGQIKNVGILGWSYRPSSDDDRDTITEYWAELIADQPSFKFENIYLFDPHKMPKQDEIGWNITNLKSAESVIKSSDLIIVATAHPEFEKVNKALLAGKIVIDPAGLINSRTSFVEEYE